MLFHFLIFAWLRTIFANPFPQGFNQPALALADDSASSGGFSLQTTDPVAVSEAFSSSSDLLPLANPDSEGPGNPVPGSSSNLVDFTSGIDGPHSSNIETTFALSENQFTEANVSPSDTLNVKDDSLTGSSTSGADSVDPLDLFGPSYGSNALLQSYGSTTPADTISHSADLALDDDESTSLWTIPSWGMPRTTSPEPDVVPDLGALLLPQMKKPRCKDGTYNMCCKKGPPNPKTVARNVNIRRECYLCEYSSFNLSSSYFHCLVSLRR